MEGNAPVSVDSMMQSILGRAVGRFGMVAAVLRGGGRARPKLSTNHSITSEYGVAILTNGKSLSVERRSASNYACWTRPSCRTGN
jgi:hypothetical protein